MSDLLGTMRDHIFSLARVPRPRMPESSHAPVCLVAHLPIIMHDGPLSAYYHPHGAAFATLEFCLAGALIRLLCGVCRANGAIALRARLHLGDPKSTRAARADSLQ